MIYQPFNVRDKTLGFRPYIKRRILYKETMKRRTVISLTTVWSALRTLLPESIYSLRATFSEYKRFSDHLRRFHGKPFMIKTLKEIHQVMKRHMCGVHVPGEFVPYSMWLKTHSCGLPRRLKHLTKLATSRKRLLRLCAISITASYTLHYNKPDLDLSNLVSTYTGYLPTESFISKILLRVNKPMTQPTAECDCLVSFISWFVPKFLRNRFKPNLDPTRNYLGLKAGPWGTPSFRYSLADAVAISSKKNSKLYTLLCLFVKEYYSEDYYLEFKATIRNMILALKFGIDANRISWFPKNFDSRLAKLSFLSEKGGKTRIITSCNFFIQYAFYGFHNDIMRILGSIPTDFTFNQDRCAQYYKDLFNSGFKFCASYDMTGATDRFPRWLQERLLSSFLGNTLSHCWGRIMSLEIWSPNHKRSVSFEVGQPMGIYSSWPVFSLTHHVLVRYCAWRCSLDPFTFNLYMVLGDDVTIFHKKVSKYYYWMLTVVLGVKVSEFKSIVSTRKSGLIAEFAKRNFANGYEVSPITPSMLVAARSSDPTLIRDIIERVLNRWSVKVNSQSVWITELFKRILYTGRRTATMRWFTSPPVFPEWIQMDDKFRKLRDDIWLFNSWKYLYIDPFLKAKRRHYDRLIKSLSVKLDRLGDPLPKLYGLPKIANIFHNITIYSGDYTALGDHPLTATIRELKSRVGDNSKQLTFDEVHKLLVTIIFLRQCLSMKVTPRGNFYQKVNKRRVLEGYRLHKVVDEVLWEIFRSDAWQQ